MLFSTVTQFAVLALCLVAGWIFGLASAPGGRKWRDKHRAEEIAHAAYRKDAEARIAAAETRVREAELAHERTRQATVAPAAPAAGIAGARVAATRRPTAADAAVPAAGVGAATTGVRSWLGGGRDDLTLIRGIDEPRARGLTDLGVRSFADIERMDAEDEREVEARLGLPAGTITAEHWREQAAMLARGEAEEHRGRFWR